MNFQAVDQAAGKNVKMWATLTAWEGIAFTIKQAKYLSCKLVDDDGVEHKCRIYEGKGSLPGQEYLNKKMEFSISSYQGTYQGSPYTSYSGFWSHGAIKGSQGGPQSTQNVPEPINSPQTYNNDIEIRKCVTCALLTIGGRPLVEEIEYWMKYIKTGVDASLPGNRPMENQSEDQRPTDEDVPF